MASLPINAPSVVNEYNQERAERRVSVLIYIGTLLILLALLYATYTTITGYHSSVQRVRDYNYQKISLDGFMTDLRDQETSVRGYLLTGDTTFLEPYNTATAGAARRKSALDSAFTSKEDRSDLDILLTLTAELTARWRARIAHVAVTDTSVEGIQPFLRQDKRLMDHVRDLYDRVSHRVLEHRAALLVDERNKGFAAPSMIIGFSFVAILVTALLFWRLTRSLMRTERSKLELRNKLRDLDQEVAQRTLLQETLRKLLDTSPSGIMSFAAVRDHDGAVIDFEWRSSNRQANAVVGREDLIGKRLLAEMPENRTAGLFDAYIHVVETGTPYHTEFFYEGHGLKSWFQSHSVKLEDGFMVTFTDITAQKRAEESNLENDRLTLTGQITRTVAHEVRNPLTNIQLAVEQLHDEVADREDLVAPYFGIVERNLERIRNLITEMLESTRKRELTLLPCRIDAIVNSALQAVSDRLALKGMRGSVNVKADLPEVMADHDLIGMAIVNIAVNAIEAMEPRDGELRLTAARAGEEVVLEISDNGKGIPPENIARLFEPFYSGRPGGLGLGLTASRSILNSHRIALDVQSTVGAGTTFTLRIPKDVQV